MYFIYYYFSFLFSSNYFLFMQTLQTSFLLIFHHFQSWFDSINYPLSQITPTTETFKID